MAEGGAWVMMVKGEREGDSAACGGNSPLVAVPLSHPPLTITCIAGRV